MSKFVTQQHQLLDNIAIALNASNFEDAQINFYKLAFNCSIRDLTFVHQTGYTHSLLSDWIQQMHKAIQSSNAEEALQAQSCVYEMLDVCLQ